MPLTILLAEDDLAARTYITDYLEAVGYAVLSASNGHEALKLLEEYQPHLLITDIAMPRMDGYALVRKVRQKPAYRLIPVIFLTARTDTRDRVLGYQAGCDVYLDKPFEPQELGAVVRNLLERVQMIEAELRSRSVTMVTPVVEREVDAKPPVPIPMSIPNLTQREQDVLCLLSDGLSNMQIGDHLYLSPRTIEKYVSSLLRKTGTGNRAELVRFAMEHHLVD